MKTERLFSKSEKLLLLSLASIQFCHIVDFIIVMPMGPQLMRVFAIDPHRFGLLVSCYTFAAGVSGILAALFIDRMDRKRMLLFLQIGFAFGTIACATAGNYEGLLLARTVTGAFGGLLSSLVLSIVGDSIGPERRATAMGIIMGAFSVASIFGVPFSLFLANQWDWHAPFTFLGIVALLLIGLISKSIPSMTRHLKHQENASTFEPFSQILKNQNQIISIVFMILLTFSHFLIIPFISNAMVANADLPERQLPLIYLIGGIISFVASPLVGRLADKYGKKLVFLIGASASIAPIYLITSMGPSSLGVILIVNALFFLCMSGRMVPATALVTSTARPSQRGSFMSVVSSSQQFALAFASYLAGIIVTSVNGRLENYQAVGYLGIAMTVLAIVANRAIKPVEGDQR